MEPGYGFAEPVVSRDVKSAPFFHFATGGIAFCASTHFLRDNVDRVRNRTHRFRRGDIDRY